MKKPLLINLVFVLPGPLSVDFKPAEQVNKRNLIHRIEHKNNTQSHQGRKPLSSVVEKTIHFKDGQYIIQNKDKSIQKKRTLTDVLNLFDLNKGEEYLKKKYLYSR